MCLQRQEMGHWGFILLVNVRVSKDSVISACIDDWRTTNGRFLQTATGICSMLGPSHGSYPVTTVALFSFLFRLSCVKYTYF